MDTYTVPKNLFLLAFAAIDHHLVPATALPNGENVRGLLNNMEACAQDNERRGVEAAAGAERERIKAELQAAATQPPAGPPA